MVEHVIICIDDGDEDSGYKQTFALVNKAELLIKYPEADFDPVTSKLITELEPWWEAKGEFCYATTEAGMTIDIPVWITDYLATHFSQFPGERREILSTSYKIWTRTPITRADIEALKKEIENAPISRD
jgi:hypothetical protein